MKVCKVAVWETSFIKAFCVCCIKKGNDSDIDNYRQLSIMNTNYKILAKIIMNRLNDILDEIMDKDQTCHQRSSDVGS